MIPPGPAVVLGIGQEAAGDDAVGLLVARAVSARGHEAREATDASALLTLLEQGRRVVLVDAVLGGGNPGDVIRLLPDALAAEVTPLSSHGIHVAEALELGRALFGDEAVRAVAIVGVVIERPATLAPGLSSAVAAAVQAAADVAVELARAWSATS